MKRGDKYGKNRRKSVLSIQSIAPDMLKIAFLLKKVAENCIKKKKNIIFAFYNVHTNYCVRTL